VNLRRLTCLAALVVLGACGAEPGPPLMVSDLQVFAPLPGSSTGVAYMTLTNQSRSELAIRAAQSPQFSRAEFHETRMEDGVMKMRSVEQIAIGAGESVRLESGGLHLMLIGANAGVAVGTPVSLEIDHDGGIVIVSATLKSRMPAE
jgi:copper(I)-binding protein